MADTDDFIGYRKPVAFQLNGEPHVVCQGCGNTVPARDQEEAGLPDEGLHIILSGWYGGFTDTMSFDNDGRLHFVLCHDCSLAVWKAIPALRATKGQHSTREDVPCCDYHWTFGHDEDGKVDTVVYGDGTVRPLEPRNGENVTQLGEP